MSSQLLTDTECLNAYLAEVNKLFCKVNYGLKGKDLSLFTDTTMQAAHDLAGALARNGVNAHASGSVQRLLTDAHLMILQCEKQSSPKGLPRHLYGTLLHAFAANVVLHASNQMLELKRTDVLCSYLNKVAAHRALSR